MEPGRTAYVQLSAWDSSLWGPNFASVPSNQIGFSDVATVFLNRLNNEVYERPNFARAAIVPVVPEPPVWALAAVGGGAALWFTRRQNPS